MSTKGFASAVLLLLSSLLWAGQEPPSKQDNNIAVEHPQKPRENLHKSAWDILDDAIQSDKAGSRAQAVRALGLITGNARARKMAEHALSDPKPEVRTGAAVALGDMKAKESIPKLVAAL